VFQFSRDSGEFERDVDGQHDEAERSEQVVESEEEDIEPAICSALFPIVPNIVLHEEGGD